MALLAGAAVLPAVVAPSADAEPAPPIGAEPPPGPPVSQPPPDVPASDPAVEAEPSTEDLPVEPAAEDLPMEPAADEIPMEAAAGPPPVFAGQPSSLLTRSGGWSWFEGPRSILDDCELQLSTVATGLTADGPARAGDVDVVTFDLATRTPRVDTLAENLEVDDHNSAGLLGLPGGKHVALYTRHRSDNQVRRAFRAPGVRHWTPLPAYLDPSPVTYSNLAFLQGEGSNGVLYDFYRAMVRPSVLRSTDRGATWQPMGPLLANGGHRPYVQYADDGHSRIDVATTNGHPREATLGSSVYHGYIQGGRLHRTDGVDVGAVGSGTNPSALSLIYQGDEQRRAWTHDVEQGLGGPVVVFSVRDLTGGLSPNQRNTYWYARWTGTEWESHEIAGAGTAVYQLEQHYLGGIVLDPADPSRVVISTDVDPVTRVPLVSGATGWVHHQLFEGTTGDGGATWTWTSITPNPTTSHLRPDVPVPSAGHRALAWMAGSYDSYVNYRTGMRAIVVETGAPATHCPEPAYEPGPNPISGDFDGDGKLDYLHYVPGGAPDTMFWGNGQRTVLRVDGTYTPIAWRRADQPDRDAILWSNPSGNSYLWRTSGTSRTFTSTLYTTERGSTPIIGDFNGDGRDDVLFYRPGAGRDVLALSQGTGYQTRTVTVSGRYRPLAGDLNGDGFDDIFWYGPGAVADSVWLFGPGGTYRSRPMTVSGHYRPSIGDRDGNGTADIYWGRSDSSGFLWSFAPGVEPSYTSTFIP